MKYSLLLIIGLLLGIIGQLLLKKGMDKYVSFNIRDLPKLIKNQAVIMGLTAYCLSLLLWLVVLSKLELSYAYPLSSLNYFFITLFSKWAFKEHVSKRRWLSIFTIILGVILVSLS